MHRLYGESDNVTLALIAHSLPRPRTSLQNSAGPGSQKLNVGAYRTCGPLTGEYSDTLSLSDAASPSLPRLGRRDPDLHRDAFPPPSVTARLRKSKAAGNIHETATACAQKIE
ncbi:hypothetical protein AAFF_G00141720 [Aldrovandia affinis]|uniref:Uncharacterized protein n=1 Tax=Aldrovandia affinis TaxID=143900 RepID=A0AAD7TCV9_9TELE|nr:hypothetical protein AAFF_G00141720 [Aldrovandia affinis]